MRGCDLAVLTLELAHELDERLAARMREGIVDRGAYAADRAMPFETVQPLRARLFRKLLLQIFRRQTKRHVHQRTRFTCGVAAIEIGCVNRAVDELRLRLVLAVHGFESALLFGPFADEIENVDAPSVRRVVERIVLRVRAIVE